MTPLRSQLRGTQAGAITSLAPLRQLAASVTLLAVATTACTPPSARQPTTRPPSPTTTTRRVPPANSGGGAAPTAPSAVVPGAAAARAFAYAPGTYRYAVTSEATVDVTADSGGGRQPRSQSVASRIVVGLRLAPRGDGARAVAGTVDSFTVTLANGAPPAAAPLLATPLAFRGTLDPAHTRLELHPGTSAAPPRVAAGGDCNSPSEALLVLAREALAVVPPGALAAGRTWDDSTESTVCRGDVPLTVRSVHHYRVEGLERRGETDAVHVSRTSDIGVAGQGSQRGLTVTVNGRGQARADLYLDTTAGHFLGGQGESTLQLDLQSPDRPAQHVVQQGKTVVEQVGG